MCVAQRAIGRLMDRCIAVHSQYSSGPTQAHDIAHPARRSVRTPLRSDPSGPCKTASTRRAPQVARAHVSAQSSGSSSGPGSAAPASRIELCIFHSRLHIDLAHKPIQVQLGLINKSHTASHGLAGPQPASHGDKSTEVRAHRVRTHLRHAACLRATSQLRAHCPLLWPQMADKRISRLDSSFGQLLSAQFGALCTAAALHAIRAALEATLLPSAMCERVY